MAFLSLPLSFFPSSRNEEGLTRLERHSADLTRCFGWNDRGFPVEPEHANTLYEKDVVCNSIPITNCDKVRMDVMWHIRMC